MYPLRPKFLDAGLYLYNRSDWIEVKRTRLVIDDDGIIPHYQSPYLTVPCVRVYDAAHKYFVDIYWKRVIRSMDVASHPDQYLTPPQYNTSEDVVCDAEGLIKEVCGLNVLHRSQLRVTVASNTPGGPAVVSTY